MRKALEKSINVIAIKLRDLVRPQSVIDLARRTGITSHSANTIITFGS